VRAFFQLMSAREQCNTGRYVVLLDLLSLLLKLDIQQ